MISLFRLYKFMRTKADIKDMVKWYKKQIKDHAIFHKNRISEIKGKIKLLEEESKTIVEYTFNELEPWYQYFIEKWKYCDLIATCISINNLPTNILEYITQKGLKNYLCWPNKDYAIFIIWYIPYTVKVLKKYNYIYKNKTKWGK